MPLPIVWKGSSITRIGTAELFDSDFQNLAIVKELFSLKLMFPVEVDVMRWNLTGMVMLPNLFQLPDASFASKNQQTFPTPVSWDKPFTIYVFIASTNKGRKGLRRMPATLKPAS